MKLIYYRNLIFLIIVASCQAQTDYKYLPTYSENGFVNVVIEIPAGTNHKVEYNMDEMRFQVDQINGKDRIINFLPYPGNYGFIPSTYMDPKVGGDGDALDILLLSESMPMKSIVEVIPVALMLLIDDGEIDSKIIVVPSKLEDQIMNILSFRDLTTNYPIVKDMLENWFLNYKEGGRMKLKGWADEKAALKEIERWMN